MKRGILIVGAGIMQIPAIKKAKDKGLFVVASDRDPEAPGFEYADHKLCLDIKDAEAHVHWALEDSEEFNIQGVFAGADVAVTVAAVAEVLNLPGIPLEVARRSNNKWLMKQRWLADGVATPFAVEVDSVKEAKEALKCVGLPAMIKAVDNAASRGTRKIESMDELEAALVDAKDHSTTHTAMVEEYVEGPEQSAELVVYKGTHYRFGVVDRHFAFQPFPIEVGHTNPTELGDKTMEAIYSLTIRAAESLGIDYGPYKSDIILTCDGPRVLELPARLSGGFHSQYTTPLATGMDPIGAAISLAVGDSFPFSSSVPSREGVSICMALFPPPGRVVSIEGLEEARAITGVEQVFCLVAPGDTIKPYRTCANRVCYVIVKGLGHIEARRIFEQAERTIRIQTVPEKEDPRGVAAG